MNQRPRTTLAAKRLRLGFDLVLHRPIECTAFTGATRRHASIDAQNFSRVCSGHENRQRSFSGVLRNKSRVLALLLCFAFPLAYAALAQSSGVEEVGKQLGNIFRGAHIQKVVVSDFVSDGGRLTLEEVLVADRLSFALLEEWGFQTLNRDRLIMHLYGPTLPKNQSLETAEFNAARAAGAEVILGTNGDMGCQDGTTGSLLRRIFCQLSRAFFILSREATGLISDSISTRCGPDGIFA